MIHGLLVVRKICHFHKFSQFLSFPEATKSAVYNAMLDHLNQILLNDLDLELDLEQEENEVKITHCLKIAHIISFEPFWHFSTILVLSKIELSGNTV